MPLTDNLCGQSDRKLNTTNRNMKSQQYVEIFINNTVTNSVSVTLGLRYCEVFISLFCPLYYFCTVHVVLCTVQYVMYEDRLFGLYSCKYVCLYWTSIIIQIVNQLSAPIV